MIGHLGGGRAEEGADSLTEEMRGWDQCQRCTVIVWREEETNDNLWHHSLRYVSYPSPLLPLSWLPLSYPPSLSCSVLSDRLLCSLWSPASMRHASSSVPLPVSNQNRTASTINFFCSKGFVGMMNALPPPPPHQPSILRCSDFSSARTRLLDVFWLWSYPGLGDSSTRSEEQVSQAMVRLLGYLAAV